MASLQDRFHNWVYKDILPEAVRYETAETPTPSTLKAYLHKLLVQFADTVFTLFSATYKAERASLKERSVKHIRPREEGEASSPVLQGRVSFLPTLVSPIEAETSQDHPPHTEIEECVISFDSATLPLEDGPPVIVEEEPLLSVVEERTVSPESSSPTLAVETPVAPLPSPVSKPTPAELAKSPAKPAWNLRSFLNTSAKVAKAVFVGGLALGGVNFFGDSSASTGAMTARMQRDDTTFGLRTQMDGMGHILEKSRWQLRSDPSLKDTFRHSLVELHVLQSELDSEPGPTELENLAHRVQDYEKSFNFTYPTIPSLATTPLTTLAAETAPVEISEAHLRSIVGSAVGDIPPVEVPVANAIDYVRDRLKLIASNPEEQRISESLQHGLAVYQQFSAQQQASTPRLADALSKAQIEIQKAEERRLIEGESATKEAVQAAREKAKAIGHVWQNEMHDAIDLLEENLNAKQTVILPYGNKGEMVTLTPNWEPLTSFMRTSAQPASWTARFYSREGSTEFGYKPYQEKSGLHKNDLLNSLFWEKLFGSALKENALHGIKDTVGIADFLPQIVAGSPLDHLPGSLSVSTIDTPFGRSLSPEGTLQSSLNDLLYVELGPEAALDFQISALEQYLEKSGERLNTNPQVFVLVKHSLATLQYACERAHAAGWIDDASFGEKVRILHTLATQTQKAQLHLSTYLRSHAPAVVDDSQGSRQLTRGEIPTRNIRPLQRGISSAPPTSTYAPPLALIPEATLTPVSPGKALSVDQVKALASDFTKAPQTALPAFRAWAAHVLPNPASLYSLNKVQAQNMLASLSEISTHLSKVPGASSQDIGAALLEAVAIGDQLIGRLEDPGLKNAHLPLPQLSAQFKNAAVFGNSALPHLDRSVQAASQPSSEIFFGSAIGNPYPDSIFYYKDAEEPSVPWGYLSWLKQSAAAIGTRHYKGADKTAHYPADLPAHIRYLIPNWKGEKVFKILEKYAFSHPKTKGSWKYIPLPANPQFDHLQNVVAQAAQFSGDRLATQIKVLADKIVDPSAHPKAVLEAVQDMTKHLNPNAVPGMVLEMLTPEQSAEILTALGKVSQQLFAANFRAGKILADPETMISFLEILTLADRVMAYSGKREHNFYTMPLQSFADIIDGSNPFFRTFDPTLDKRRQGLQSWLSERQSLSYTSTEEGFYPLFDNFPGFFDTGSDLNIPKETGRTLPASLELAYMLKHNPYRLYDFRQHDLGKNFDGLKNQEKEALQIYQSHSLPDWYYALRDMSLFTYHAARSGFINPKGDRAKPEDFQTVSSIRWSGIGNSVDHRLSGVSPSEATYYPDIPDGVTRGHHFGYLEPAITQPGAIKESRDIAELHESAGDKDFRPGLSPVKSSVYDLNYVMARDAASRRGEDSSDTYRIHLSMRAEPSLQTPLAISEYIANPQWLLNRDKQLEFANLLFTPSLLTHLQQPEIGPKAESDLAKFLMKQFNINGGNKEMQAYLVEMGIRLHQYSQAARAAALEAYKGKLVPSELVTFVQLPQEKLLEPALPQAEKSSYGALRALTFLTKESLQTEEVTPFLQAVFAYHSFESLKTVNSITIDRQIEGMLKRFAPSIQSTLYPQGVFNPAPLKAALQGISSRAESLTFKPSETNPFLIHETSGAIDINLQEGVVIEAGRPGVPIPSEARVSPVYTMIHGENSYRATSVDRLTYRFTDKHNHINSLQKDPTTREWHLYQELESGEPFQMVTAGWKGEGVTAADKWLKSDWMLNNYSHWYRGGRNPEVRLLDHEGREAYRVRLGGAEGRTIQAIYKMDTTSGEKLKLADVDQEAYRWTHQLEDPGFVHIWLSESSGRGKQIQFPRLGDEGLSFTWKNERWQLDSAPQYQVVDRQMNPLFPGQTNFLHLRSDKGAERLLIPRQRPQIGPDGALTFNVPFDRKQGEASQQRVLVVDKNPKTKKFDSKDPETIVYMGLMHLAHRDYTRTHELLTSLVGHSSRFSEETMEVLDWIIDGSILPETSQANALRLFAAHLKSRNIAQNQKTKNEAYSVPTALSRNYLRDIEGIPGLRLPMEQEVALFKQSLISSDPSLPIEEALAKMQSANPVAAREAFDYALPRLLYGPQRVLVQTALRERIPVLPAAARPVAFESQEIGRLVTVDSEAPASKTSPTDAIFKSDWFIQLAEPTQNLFRELGKGAADYQGSRDTKQYKLVNPEAFVAKRIALETADRQLTREMEGLKLQFVNLANPLPSDPKKAQHLMMQLEAGTAKLITPGQLIEAWGTEDIRNYQSLTPSLTDQQAQKLDELITNFVDLVPSWQHHKQLIDSMCDVEELVPKAHTVEGRHLLQLSIKNFQSIAQASRQFDPDAPRLMKRMEYETGTYYRGMQVESLKKLGLEGLTTEPPKTSAVHRIGVGVGKTSRLLPSMLQSYAEAGKLALAIMPEAQLASAGKEFTHIMLDVYGVPTLELTFTRNDATPDKLKTTLKSLQEALREGHPVLISGKSLRVLRNLYIEHLRGNVDKVKQGQITENDKLVVEQLQQILEILETTPIIDEVHKEFDPRVETNHPFGEARALPTEYGVITLNLFEMLRDEDIQKLMHFSCIPREILGSVPFSKENFASVVAEPLVTKFLDKVKANGKDLDKELHSLGDFLRGLTSERLQEVKNYILGRGKISDWIKTLASDSPIKNQLSLVRGQIRDLMPTTLDASFGKRYGYAHPGDLIPTPFSNGRVNKGSQFSSPFARYNYIMEGAFFTGVRLPMIDSIVKDLRKERYRELSTRSEEVQAAKGKRLKTAADQQFQQLFTIPELNLDSPKLEEELMKQVSGSPSLLRHIIKSYALPKVKVFPKNLKATSQHLGDMFPTWQGFSGTPSNFPAYPGNFTKPTDGEVVGRMLTLIAEQTIGASHVVDLKPKDILLSDKFSSADAFIDAGGLFANENLESLADAWGQKTGRAAVRTDPTQGVVIKMTPQDRSVPLRATQVPLDKRVVVYGQPDVVGTDIQHKRTGRAIVSISKDTTFTEVEQAAGRMRGIEAGQKVELLVLKDDAEVMRQKLGLPEGHVLSSPDMLRYTVIVESEKQMTDSEISLHHKVRNVVDSLIKKWLLQQDPNALIQMKGIDELLDKIFLPDVNTNPSELFGQEESIVTSEEVFNGEVNSLLGDGRPLPELLKRFFGDQAAALLTELRAQAKQVVGANLKYVNEKVTAPSSAGLDMEQEQELLQEQETQVEQETEVETEMQQEQVGYPGGTRPARHKPWADLSTESVASWSFWQSKPSQKTEEARLYTLQEELQSSSHTKSIADLFSPGIETSSNFQNTPPLEGPQKPAQMAAVIRHKGTPEYRVAFLEPWEVAKFKKALDMREGTPIPFSFDTGIGASHEYFGNIEYDHVFTAGPSIFTPQPIAGGPTEVGDADLWIGTLSGGQVAGDSEVFDIRGNAELRNLWALAQLYGGRLDFQGDPNRPEIVAAIKDRLDKWSTEKAKTSSKSKQAWLDEAESTLKKLWVAKEDLLARYSRTDVGIIFASLRTG